MHRRSAKGEANRQPHKGTVAGAAGLLRDDHRLVHAGAPMAQQHHRQVLQARRQSPQGPRSGRLKFFWRWISVNTEISDNNAMRRSNSGHRSPARTTRQSDGCCSLPLNLAPTNPPLTPTAVELSQLRQTWSAEFIPLPADLHVPRGGGLKSALLNSTAVQPGPLPSDAERVQVLHRWTPWARNPLEGTPGTAERGIHSAPPTCLHRAGPTEVRAPPGQSVGRLRGRVR